MKDSLEMLTRNVRSFAQARDWEQFHTPKNLAMALSGETGEVLEHFQWLTAEQSQALDEPTRQAVSLELADVLLYLVRLADVLGIDLIDAANRKISINGERYPVEKAKGRANKYDQL